jgi:hypothetical protein
MELHGPSAGRIAAPEINTVVRQALSALRLEAAAISRALGVPVRSLVCVHGAHVDVALTTGNIDILPAGRLANVLTATGQRLTSADVSALVTRAHTMLRPA